MTEGQSEASSRLVLAPGERLTAKLLGRHSTDTNFECVVVLVEEGRFWCAVLGRVDVTLRPTTGASIHITVPDGIASKTATTTIDEVKLTRRGVTFALKHPEVWEVRMLRPVLRFPIDLPATVLREEDVDSPEPHQIPCTITEFSLNGARLNSRIMLREGQALLLRFEKGGQIYSLIARVARAIAKDTSAMQSPTVGIVFEHLPEDTYKAVKELVDKQSAFLFEKRQAEDQQLAEVIEAVKTNIIPNACAKGDGVPGLSDVDPELIRLLRESAA